MTSPSAPSAIPAPTLATLLRLAWPIIISRSTQTVVGLCDALLVAPRGEDALAATTTGAMNVFALFILPLGVVFVVGSFAAQKYGQGDARGARRYAFYGLAVAAMAQLLCQAGIVATPAVLARLDYSDNVRGLMDEYMAARLLSGGAAIGMEALAGYYGGLGNTRRAMVASLVAMVLNVALCLLLIDGNLGFPALGVRGAAIASSIATWVAFLGLLGFFLLEGHWAGEMIPAGLAARELGRLLWFGLPSGLNWFFEFFSFNFFINVVVAGLGTRSLAAFMTVLQINSVSFMPAFGIASAGAILVGQSIGARRPDDVPGTLRITMLTAATWQGLVGLAYVAIPMILVRPFASDDPGAPALLDLAARMLALSAAWQLFDAAASTIAEALRAAGDTAFTMWARVAIAWGLFAPGAWISVHRFHGGEHVAVGWVVLYLGLLAGVLWLRFRTGAWRRIDLIGSGSPLPPG